MKNDPGIKHASVVFSIFHKLSDAEMVNLGDHLVAAGSQSADVAGSPTTTQTLHAMKAATDKLRSSLAAYQATGVLAVTRAKTLGAVEKACKDAARVYLRCLDHTAGGNAAVITAAGGEVVTPSNLAGPVEMPSKVLSHPGTLWGDSLITWPAARGARAYAIQYNPTPAVPDNWISLPSGRSRRRVVKALAPGGTVLVRIASIGATQSDWTAPITATAK